MSDVSKVWRQKSDEELQKAAEALHEYTEEGRKVILAELSRRSRNAPVNGEDPGAKNVDNTTGVQSTRTAGRDQSAQTANSVPFQVSVIDVNMRFGSMVLFMVKWVLASIPAFIILIFIGTLGVELFSALITILAEGR